MSNELAVQEVNPLAILQQAVAQGASIEQLTALMGLQERWEANAARKAFNVAFSSFKAEAVTIVKNVVVKDGPLKDKKYVDLFGVVSAITPVLSKHELSHSWKLSKDEPAWMEVTCTIRHALGHSESVSMGSAPDTGPGRNAIQARGSAKSYLERYTLLAATGMAASGTDDDGNGGSGDGKPRMAAEDLAFAIENIDNAGTPAELKTIYEAAYKQAKEINDRAAMGKIVSAKDKRKGEL